MGFGKRSGRETTITFGMALHSVHEVFMLVPDNLMIIFNFIMYILTMKKIYSTYNCTDVIDVLCMVEEIRLLKVIDVLADLWPAASVDFDAHMNWVNAPNQRNLCRWMENSFQNWPSGWEFHC